MRTDVKSRVRFVLDPAFPGFGREPGPLFDPDGAG
jgi:hypothetical protein